MSFTEASKKRAIPRWGKRFAVRQGKWKLVSDPGIERIIIFMILMRIHFEKNGLKDKYPERYKAMFDLCLNWINKTPAGLTHNGSQRPGGEELMRKYQ